MSLNLESRLEPAQAVVTRGVGDDTMLLDLESGTYFGLDPIGSEIWQAIENNQSMGEACDRLEARYDVTREQLEHDVLALARELVEKGLAAPAG